MVTPGQRRAVVTEMRAVHALAVQQSCRYLGVHRALVSYRPQRDPQHALRAQLRTLALAKPRWGSPRLTWRLRRDGWVVNHKRVERLLREERLLVGQRPRRKRVAPTRVPTPPPTRPDEAMPYKKMGMAAMAALLAPLALAVGFEVIYRRISSRQQLETTGAIAVVAEVTTLPTRVRSRRRSGGRTDTIDHEVQLFEESIDGLRTYLSLVDATRGHKVLAVTSAIRGKWRVSA